MQPQRCCCCRWLVRSLFSSLLPHYTIEFIASGGANERSAWMNGIKRRKDLNTTTYIFRLNGHNTTVDGRSMFIISLIKVMDSSLSVAAALVDCPSRLSPQFHSFIAMSIILPFLKCCSILGFLLLSIREITGSWCKIINEKWKISYIQCKDNYSQT